MFQDGSGRGIGVDEVSNAIYVGIVKRGYQLETVRWFGAG